MQVIISQNFARIWETKQAYGHCRSGPLIFSGKFYYYEEKVAVRKKTK